MALKDFVGLGVAFVLLAGFSMAVANGTGTAQILAAGGNSFARIINAATLKG